MKQRIDLLDKGFIEVIDTMGTDIDVVNAARISYAVGNKVVRKDRALIRYLMYHRHTSPFEMCEIKLHVKLPMFVARQWVRHRTANINEISGRYSILDDDYYLPDVARVQYQASTNKQASGDSLPIDEANAIIAEMRECSDKCFALYNKLMNTDGVSRELSRIALPLSTYTRIFWKIDANNLLKFLSLRNSPDAQYEIRVYAQAMEDILKDWMPHTYEAYNDFIKHGASISKNAIEFVRDYFEGKECKDIVLSRSEKEDIKTYFDIAV